jgi:hypothetical protein
MSHARKHMSVIVRDCLEFSCLAGSDGCVPLVSPVLFSTMKMGLRVSLRSLVLFSIATPVCRCSWRSWCAASTACQCTVRAAGCREHSESQGRWDHSHTRNPEPGCMPLAMCARTQLLCCACCPPRAAHVKTTSVCCERDVRSALVEAHLDVKRGDLCTVMHDVSLPVLSCDRPTRDTSQLSPFQTPHLLQGMLSQHFETMRIGKRHLYAMACTSLNRH